MIEPLVLAVDQDTSQLNSIETFLTQEDYKVRTAENSRDAIKSMGKNRASIVICEETIPENGGLDFLRMVKHRYPETIRCLISNQPESESILLALKNREICTCLNKPWEEKDLLKKIRDCVERFQTCEANRKSMKVILSAYQKSEQSRDKDLILSKAILNVLPQAAIVLNDDFHVIISNDIFNLKIAVEFHNDDLPEELRMMLQERMQESWSDLRFNYSHNNFEYGIRIRPLRNTDSKTAIVFFDAV